MPYTPRAENIYLETELEKIAEITLSPVPYIDDIIPMGTPDGMPRFTASIKPKFGKLKELVVSFLAIAGKSIPKRIIILKFAKDKAKIFSLDKFLANIEGSLA